MRRLFAMLTTLSMLHLSLVAGDLACATHHADGAPMEGMVSAEGLHGDASMNSAMTASASHGHDAAQPAPKCSTPVRPDCCEATTSCSVVTTVASVERAMSPDMPAAATPELPSAVLESVLTAPDTPPPKA